MSVPAPSSGHTEKITSQTQEATLCAHPSTLIETRTELTALYRLIRSLIRPLRPLLVGIKPLNVVGSPRITNRPSDNYGVSVSERRIQVPSTASHPLPQANPATNSQQLWLYDLVPKPAPRQSTDVRREHTVYYFAGGGFQAPGSAEHWKLTARLARDLATEGVHVVMVSYPLAPKSPARDSLPLLRSWLAQTLSSTAETGETISLMGDSAGGNIALSLTFWWSTTLERALADTTSTGNYVRYGHKNIPVPAWKNLALVLAMSPPCDFRNTNPAIKTADQLDPVLTRSVTDRAADLWCKDWCPTVTEEPKEREEREKRTEDGKSDPALSLNLQPESAWKALRSSGLLVHGIIGTADLLAPDAKVFMDRCVEERIRGNWLVWEHQMHCFPLLVCHGIGEGRDGYRWIRDRVKEVVV